RFMYLLTTCLNMWMELNRCLISCFTNTFHSSCEFSLTCLILLNIRKDRIASNFPLFACYFSTFNACNIPCNIDTFEGCFHFLIMDRYMPTEFFLIDEWTTKWCG